MVRTVCHLEVPSVQMYPWYTAEDRQLTLLNWQSLVANLALIVPHLDSPVEMLGCTDPKCMPHSVPVRI